MLLSWVVLLLSLYMVVSGFMNVRDYSNYSEFSCEGQVCTLKEYGVTGGGKGALYNLKDPLNVVSFDRPDFDRSSPVRIGDGKAVKVAGLKRRQLRKLGYSYSVVYIKEVPNKENGEGGVQRVQEEVRTGGREKRRPYIVTIARGANRRLLFSIFLRTRFAPPKTNNLPLLATQLLVSRGNLGKRTSRERASVLNQKMRSKMGNVKMTEGKAYAVGSLVWIGLGIMLGSIVTLIGEFESEGFNERYGEKKRG